MRMTDGRLGGGVTLFLFLFILLPLFAVMLNAVVPGIFFGDAAFNGFGIVLEMFERPLWYVSLKNSVLLGLGSACVGTILGGMLATMRAKWEYALGRWLDVSVWALLIAPSFMIAQGWVLFASADGLADSWFGWDWVSTLVFQPGGLIVIMGLTKFPLAYLAILAAMEWNADSYKNAARLSGARPWTLWRTIELPLVLPAYLAGWTLVFIDTIGDFGLPAALATVYRFPTLPYSIYSAINQSPVRFDMAGVLAFYLVLILIAAMGILVYAIRRSRVDFLTGRASRQVRQKPQRSWLVNGFTGLMLLLTIGIPIGTSSAVSFMARLGEGFSWSNFTLAHYAAVWSGGNKLDHAQLSILEGLGHSLLIAGSCALISMVVGFVVAYVLTFTDFRLKGAIQLITVVSLAVPGVILGIGYIFIWNQKWLEPIGLHLYGEPSLLVLAAVAGAIPYAVRVQLGAFANLSPSLLKAASVQGAGSLTRMRTILLPIIKNTLLIATLAAFGTSVFDLATAAMLQPPNFTLMPLVIDEAFEFAQYGYATAASVLGGGAVVLMILAIQAVGKGLFSAAERRRRKGELSNEAYIGSESSTQGVRFNEYS